MSGFSPDWLALREAADHRSRSQSVANTLQTRFLQREIIWVLDLGCGTGSNLRATSALLPDKQCWTLVDNDPALLAAAKVALIAWADESLIVQDQLELRKGRARLYIRFRQADLTTELESVLDLDPQTDLVTASAFFDSSLAWAA